MRICGILQQTIRISLALVGLLSLIMNMFWLQTDKYKVSYQDGHAAKYISHPCDCGGSVSEAISRGCVYDELSAAWLPEQCRDDELTAEFARQGDGPDGSWTYFADKNHTHPLTMEDISRYGDNPSARFHVDHEWHRLHCLFLWVKEHQFKAEGKYFDPRYDNDRHIRHCIDMILHLHYGTASGVSLLG